MAPRHRSPGRGSAGVDGNGSMWAAGTGCSTRTRSGKDSRRWRAWTEGKIGPRRWSGTGRRRRLGRRQAVRRDRGRRLALERPRRARSRTGRSRRATRRVSRSSERHGAVRGGSTDGTELDGDRRRGRDRAGIAGGDGALYAAGADGSVSAWDRTRRELAVALPAAGKAGFPAIARRRGRRGLSGRQAGRAWTPQRRGAVAERDRRPLRRGTQWRQRRTLRSRAGRTSCTPCDRRAAAACRPHSPCPLAGREPGAQADHARHPAHHLADFTTRPPPCHRERRPARRRLAQRPHHRPPRPHRVEPCPAPPPTPNRPPESLAARWPRCWVAALVWGRWTRAALVCAWPVDRRAGVAMARRLRGRGGCGRSRTAGGAVVPEAQLFPRRNCSRGRPEIADILMAPPCRLARSTAISGLPLDWGSGIILR